MSYSIGSKLKVVRPNGHQELERDDAVVVEKDLSNGLIRVRVTRTGRLTDAMANRFELVKNAPAVVTPARSEVKQWSFKTTSPLAMNFNDILNGLSYKHPVALITREFRALQDVQVDVDDNGGAIMEKQLVDKIERMVALDRQLVFKSRLCGIAMPEHRGTIADNIVVLNEGEHFAPWQLWAKTVKRSPWPEAHREKAVVTVILANV